MPDVGVLNLQIHDNSEQAATGLENLVGALTRIKSTVSGARIGTVANQIKRIAEVVDNNISTSTISKLNEFCSALSKLQGISNVNIRFNQSGGIKEIRDTVNNTKISVDGINSGFDYVGRRVAEVNETMRDFYNSVRSTFELMQDKSWTGGFEQFQQLLNGWLRMRSAMALGPGTAMSVVPEETGWTYWKDGAIEVEGTVSDATSEINGYLEGTQQLLYGTVETVNQVRDATGEAVNEEEEYAKWFDQVCESMREQAEEAERIRKAQEDAFYGPSRRAYDIGETNAMADNITQLDLLKAKLRDAEIAYNRFVNTLGAADTKTIKAGLAVSNLRDKIWEYENALAEANSESNVENLVPETKAAETETNRLTSALQRLKSAFNSLKTHAKGIGSELGNLKGAMSRMFPTISGLIKRFSQIAKYRMLRAILKQITEGFREGVENVYHYSKAVGTDFAPTMDSAASSLLQMKNSIGAAAAPLIQALVPALQTVVNWVITAMNAVNQFISLLAGKSEWTEAIPATANAFEDTAKSAGAAGKKIKEAKNLLAGWDELNIIQQEPSDSGGGVGGSAKKAAEDYKKMFKQSKLFNDQIKKIADFIKRNFEDVLDVVKMIGLAMLAWKFSNAVTGVLGLLSSLLAAGLVITIAWKLTGMFDKEYLRTGEKGWLIADFLTNAVGSVIAGKIVSKVLGGKAGLVTFGLEMLVSGGISYGIYLAHKDEDNAKALRDLGLVKGAIGDAAIGLGFALATGSAGLGVGMAVAAAPLFVLVAAVACTVETLETGSEVAKRAFAETGKGGISVDDLFTSLQEELDRKTSGFELVIKAFSGAAQIKTDLGEAFGTITNLTNIIRGDGKLTQEEANAFNSAWTTVFSSFDQLIAIDFETLLTGLSEALSSQNEVLREQAKEARISLLMIENNMTEAEARFQDHMTSLSEKVASGTATEEETAQYLQYLDSLAGGTDTALDDLKQVLDGSKTIDFGDINNATEFITNMGTAATDAKAKIDAALDAEMEALKDLRKNAKRYHDLGYWTDEEYANAILNFDNIEEILRTNAEEKKGEIDTLVHDTWEDIMAQAASGISLDDKTGADTLMYFADIFQPLISAAQDAGIDIGEELSEALGIGMNFEDLVKNGKLEDAVRFTRKTIADALLKKGEVLDVTQMVGFKNWDELGIEAQKEFARSLKDDWGFEMAIRSLYSATGKIGPLDVLFGGWGNFSAADKTEFLNTLLSIADREDVIDMAKRKFHLSPIDILGITSGANSNIPENVIDLADYIDFENGVTGYDLEMDIDQSVTEPISAPAIDQTNFVSSLESMYETTRRYVLGIIRMLNSISGVDTSAYRSLTAGINKIHMQGFASGGFVNSGDIVMANENGNFEMMGRMGNQPVVANNQQIVAGISQGVSTANGEVVAAINNLINVVQRQGNRPVQVNIGSSARLGQTCERSIDMWNKQNGR